MRLATEPVSSKPPKRLAAALLKLDFGIGRACRYKQLKPVTALTAPLQVETRLRHVMHGAQAMKHENRQKLGSFFVECWAYARNGGGCMVGVEAAP